MYEIDLSTLMLIGIDNNKTKVITKDKEFIIDENDKNFNKELRSKRKDILNNTTNTV